MHKSQLVVATLALSLAGCGHAAAVLVDHAQVAGAPVMLRDCGAGIGSDPDKSALEEYVAPSGPVFRVCFSVDNNSDQPVSIDRRKARLVGKGIELSASAPPARAVEVAPHEGVDRITVYFDSAELHPGEELALMMPVRVGADLMMPAALRYRVR